MTLQNPEALPLLLVLPLLAWLGWRGRARRLESVRAFAGEAGEHALEGLGRRKTAANVLRVLGVGFLVLALLRPAWQKVPKEVDRGGRDVLFLLDVSRSMLGTNLAPSRLGYSKRAILDCLPALEGSRVGLVTFAGSSSIACPLTTDLGFFRQALEEAGPERVSQGGTLIGDAVRKSVDKVLDPSRAGAQDVILISDGGDRGSNPETASEELNEVGCFFIAIGIGDAATGARVPARGGSGFTMHEGREVWSRLDVGPLEEMAAACDYGAFVNAGMRRMEMADLYQDLVQHFLKDSPSARGEMMRWREEFPWMLGAALLCLIAGQVLVAFGRRDGGGLAHGHHGAGQAACLALCLLIGGANRAMAAPPGETFNDGCQALEDGDHGMAIDLFSLAMNDPAAKDALREEACYNLGIAHYMEARAVGIADQAASAEFYVEASKAFRGCLDARPGWEEAAWNYELTRLRLKELTDRMERQQDQQESDDRSGEEQEEGEGEESEDGEESDSEGEWEESEDEGMSQASDHASEQMAMDLENANMPPPMLDPEDIFREESLNNDVREKEGGTKYVPVERDW